MMTGSIAYVSRMALITWSLILLPGGAHAQDCGIGVIDGDTVRTCGGPIRLRTCNAPEPFMPGGRAAAKRLDEILVDAGWIELACHRDRSCRDILNRQICDVLVDGENICEVLIAEGHAKPQRAIRACQLQTPIERTPLFRSTVLRQVWNR
jgi:endonuclease YncB( thermonuclease family)